MSMGMKVAFETLGCKLNYAETSTLAREFAENGFEVVSSRSQADVYIVNTCTVTAHSDKKSRNIIHRLHRRSPNAVMVVTGCYAQLSAKEVASIEGVDLVFGAGRKGEIFSAVMSFLQEKRQRKAVVDDIDTVRNFFPAFSSGERTRSFLKIQDGCNYTCSYCAIPRARGVSRNIPIKDIVAQAQAIASVGVKEIVLTGVNTGDFGRSTGESLLSLIEALEKVDGIERYRISSIEPNLITAGIVDRIASGSKFLPHFHIPLQSGSDLILGKMRRRYNTAGFKAKIDYIRSRIENVFIGMDVIVGFPGETEEEFGRTVAFLKEVRPAFIHVFPYSVRAGTVAAEMPGQVPEQVKAARVRCLEELSGVLHGEFIRQNSGREAKVLFESKSKGGMMSGYTENYIRVERPYDSSLVGRITSVVI